MCCETLNTGITQEAGLKPSLLLKLELFQELYGTVIFMRGEPDSWLSDNMKLARTTEMRYLEHYYELKGSQLLVLYGQKRVGKTTLVREFMKDKPYTYLYARPCSERELQYEWGRELRLEEDYPAYDNIFFSMTQESVNKQIIVIDEFQNAIHAGDSFMEALTSFMHNEWNNQPVFIILISSAIGWIENTMVSKIGKAAYEISGFLKIKEFGFRELEQYFAYGNKEESVKTYSVLGGIPGYWELFDHSKDFKQNICDNLIHRNSFLHDEANHLVEAELRETNVYHAILAAIAAGRYKLNELHLHTGFSRAKISVYLKNLMELEIVEKVFSFETAGKDNTMKGIYRITSPLVHFYFRFLYPHFSELEMLKPEVFYERYIEPELDSYVEEHFKKACQSILNEMNEHERLPIHIDEYGEWVGKVGNIHYIGQNEAGSYLISYANWEKPVFDYSDYEWLLFCCEKAKITADYVYIFNRGKFDQKLLEAGKFKENLHLINLKR